MSNSAGATVAAALAGAWRPAPPAWGLSADALARITPLLLEGGAGGLVWRRLRRSGVAECRATRPLRDAYRRHTLQAADHESDLRGAVGRLRAGGVEPILVKGWAAARLYPETGLRPYGDLDLCVAPAQLSAAMAVLTEAAGRIGWVELHEGVPDVADRPWAELYRRSRLVALGDGDVRLLGPEDQLRHLCLHFWRHVGCRPLWLCDVAALLEALPAEFDWDYCLAGNRRGSDWVRCVIGLAGCLLGARVPGAAERAGGLPPWLGPTVVWRWGAGFRLPPLPHYLRHRREFPAALLYRWLNPVRATLRMRQRARDSLLLTQLLALAGRPLQLAVRLGRGLARFRPAPNRPYDLHRERVF
jgi:hypothetical protein